MAGVALGLAGPGLESVTKSKRALSSAVPSSSSPSCVSCSASYSSSRNVRPQKSTLVLRSSFVARTTHSSFWDGGGTEFNFNFLIAFCFLFLFFMSHLLQKRTAAESVSFDNSKL